MPEFSALKQQSLNWFSKLAHLGWVQLLVPGLIHIDTVSCGVDGLDGLRRFHTHVWWLGTASQEPCFYLMWFLQLAHTCSHGSVIPRGTKAGAARLLIPRLGTQPTSLLSHSIGESRSECQHRFKR